MRKNSREGLTPADKVGIGMRGNTWETLLLNGLKIKLLYSNNKAKIYIKSFCFLFMNKLRIRDFTLTILNLIYGIIFYIVNSEITYGKFSLEMRIVILITFFTTGLFFDTLILTRKKGTSLKVFFIVLSTISVLLLILITLAIDTLACVPVCPLLKVPPEYFSGISSILIK